VIAPRQEVGGGLAIGEAVMELVPDELGPGGDVAAGREWLLAHRGARIVDEERELTLPGNEKESEGSSEVKDQRSLTGQCNSLAAPSHRDCLPTSALVSVLRNLWLRTGCTK
jgi:hypothetical protein